MECNMKTGITGSITALCAALLYCAALQADSGLSTQFAVGAEQPAATQAQVRFVIHVPERLSLSTEADLLQADSNGGEILSGQPATNLPGSEVPVTTAATAIIASP